MIGVAIVGASGYASRELIRILLNHPGARVTVATSRQDEAPRLDALHPSLTGRIDLTCEPFDADRIAERASVAFLGLPHTASLAVTPDLRRRGVRVIDLSADYRLTDSQIYADWYGHAHTDPQGLDASPEAYRAEVLIMEMTFVAPGERPERIHKYGHTHLDDFLARADRFENEVIIASHFSTRMHPEQIQRIIEKRLPASLRGRLKIWL